jgi:hypothetical protein
LIVRWQIFEHAGLRCEAQAFLPESGQNAKALLFCPGFPGAGATLFEQRHAGALTAEGYDVYVLKHKGIRLDSPTAPFMVNNSVRLAEGRREGQGHIGGGVATIDDWLSEPFPTLADLDRRYDSIDVIGNSFGALSSLWSLTTPGVASQKVKSLLLYAGAQGMADSIMRIWKPEYINVPRIADKVALENADKIVARLKTVYEDLPKRVRNSLPAHISLKYLVVERDELLTLADTEQFRAAIGGRGDIVMNTIDKARPEHGLMAHDTPEYPTSDILRLLSS